MRYEKNESTYILGEFDSGDTVTIDVYKISDGSQVVSSGSCTEIGTTGVFRYEFSQTITNKTEYLWIMSNGSYTRSGKIVLGGWMDTVKDKVDSNLDVAVSTRSNHTPSDVDTQLSGTHGSGSWEGTTPSDIWNYTTRKLTHGELTTEGKNIAKEETLTQHDTDIKSEINDVPSDVDSQLSTNHGSGSWEGATAQAVADAVWDETRNEHTTSGTFGATDEWAGQVDVDAITDAVWDESISEHTTRGSTGYYLKYATVYRQRHIWTQKEKAELLDNIDAIKEALSNISPSKQTKNMEIDELKNIMESISNKVMNMTIPAPVVKVNNKKLFKKMQLLYQNEVKKYNESLSEINSSMKILIKKLDKILNNKKDNDYSKVYEYLKTITKMIAASLPTETLEKVITDD